MILTARIGHIRVTGSDSAREDGDLDTAVKKFSEAWPVLRYGAYHCVRACMRACVHASHNCRGSCILYLITPYNRNTLQYHDT